MKIDITIPDELWKEVTSETDDVSAFIVEALEEKLAFMRQQRARKKIMELAGTENFKEEVLKVVQQERRKSGRV